MRTILLWFSIGSAALGTVVSGGRAFAQVPPLSGLSAELLASETRRRVTDEVKRFLEERCPQQCDVGEVTVQIEKRKPPVGSTPGFEELAPDVKEFLVQRADVSLLVDKRLTNDFRTGLRAILAKKLSAEGISNVMHETLIDFPTAQELPERPQALAPQAAPPQPMAGAAPERKEPATYYLPERSAWERFLENLPLLLGLVLCGAVVWFTLRQYQRLIEPRVDAAQNQDDAERQRVAANEAAADTRRREQDRAVEAFRTRLRDAPLAREVMRDLVVHGPVADAALAVKMLDPSILDGVRGDPECRPGLSALDAYLAERLPPDSHEERRRVLGDLERRLLRVQVSRGTQPSALPFAYLREIEVPLFVHLLADEPPATQALILRHAPSSLVQAFVERQSPGSREQLVRPLLDNTALQRSDVAALADRFAKKLAHHTVVDRADPIGDLLQAAAPEERRRLLSTLRSDPEALRAALGSFVSEETLHALDGEILATAMTRLDTATAALFVGSLDEVARQRVLAALPLVTAQSIAEEADLLTASAAHRAQVRRVALGAIRRAVEDRGLDLADMNRRVLGGKEVA